MLHSKNKNNKTLRYRTRKASNTTGNDFDETDIAEILDFKIHVWLSIVQNNQDYKNMLWYKNIRNRGKKLAACERTQERIFVSALAFTFPGLPVPLERHSRCKLCFHLQRRWEAF